MKYIIFLTIGLIQSYGSRASDDPNLFQRHYATDLSQIKQNGFFEKLQGGLTVGQDVFVGKNAPKAGVNKAQSSGDFIGQNQSKLEQNPSALQKLSKVLRSRIEDKSALALGPQIPSPFHSFNFREFRECTLDVLPLIKQVLGALQNQKVALVTRSYLEISYRTSQAYGSLRRGEVPCTSYLGKINLWLKEESEVDRLTEASLILSTFSQLAPTDNQDADNGLIALWVLYQKGNNKAVDFWRQYWTGFSMDLLLKGLRHERIAAAADKSGFRKNFDERLAQYNALKNASAGAP